MHQYNKRRSEDEIKSFVKSEWKETEGVTIPTTLPTMMEEIRDAFKLFKQEMMFALKSDGNYTVKAVVYVFLFMCGLIFFFIIYFLIDCYKISTKPAKSTEKIKKVQKKTVGEKKMKTD